MLALGVQAGYINSEQDYDSEVRGQKKDCPILSLGVSRYLLCGEEREGFVYGVDGNACVPSFAV